MNPIKKQALIYTAKLVSTAILAGVTIPLLINFLTIEVAVTLAMIGLALYTLKFIYDAKVDELEIKERMKNYESK